MEVMTRKEALARGLKTYFNGKPCPKGHLAKKRVCGGCTECQKTLFKTYRSSRRNDLNERAAAWRKANPERQRELTDNWKANNPDKLCAYEAKRRAAQLRATPLWADLNKIAQVYKVAAEWGLTVDHVVPLQGETVCGLHVHNNLQLMKAGDNFAKHNKFDDWS